MALNLARRASCLFRLFYIHFESIFCRSLHNNYHWSSSTCIQEPLRAAVQVLNPSRLLRRHPHLSPAPAFRPLPLRRNRTGQNQKNTTCKMFFRCFFFFFVLELLCICFSTCMYLNRASKRQIKWIWCSETSVCIIICSVCVRYERHQARLKEELAKIAQREELTRAMTRERLSTRREAEKVKQLVRTQQLTQLEIPRKKIHI